MNVISEIFVSHRKDGDVGQGADVRELLQLVLDQTGVDAAPKDNLQVQINILFKILGL